MATILRAAEAVARERGQFQRDQVVEVGQFGAANAHRGGGWRWGHRFPWGDDDNKREVCAAL
ncbi:hypothetical protein [Rhodanobacter sp. 115]|uniref:hypothetical protein n=1 Tax=Rhodanobacter sp. FW021-MT20 TaxID=1162282 RepID=UPI000260D66F|nr:hypothetical protein [Rhodanobacter sp. 115]EIM03356.1 hypothetical protein UU5_00740 [Rhodanobacter sp. 115]